LHSHLERTARNSLGRSAGFDHANIETISSHVFPPCGRMGITLTVIFASPIG
jgi:hypothetical protein